MTFNEVLDTWRTQDKTPIYGVNRDLLQLVVKHEQNEFRRALRLDAWVLSITCVGFAIGLALFFLMIYFERNYGDEPRPFWGYVVAAAGVTVALGSPIALWVSRRRQARRERDFGNTLRDELQRHLSLVDYMLSRKGRAWQAFLAIAPLAVLAVTLSLLSRIVNGLPVNPARMTLLAIVIPTFFAFGAVRASRRVREALLPRQRRLMALLTELDAERSVG